MQPPDFDEPEVEPPGEPDPEGCESCGSPNIRRRPKWLYFIVLAAIGIATGVAMDLQDAAFFFVAAVAIFIIIGDRWRCEECGETWK